MVQPFKTYNGGKSSNGVFQSLINLIPPHDIFITGFAGNCGVLANKRPALKNIVIDKDTKVIQKWKELNQCIIAFNCDTAGELVSIIAEYCDNGSERIFLFLDPPYLKEVRKSDKKIYRFEMMETQQHENLVNMILELPANVNIMLTHYPCIFYDNVLYAWNKIDIKGRTRTGIVTERVYMNYDYPTELHDYTFFGQDFRKRERYNRIRLNLLRKLDKLTALERNYILSSLK